MLSRTPEIADVMTPLGNKRNYNEQNIRDYPQA